MASKRSNSGDMHARFAHTITFINPSLIAMFGGAVGDPGKYNITKDVLLYDIAKDGWKPVPATNDPPARAAHAACAVDESKLVVYGGATGGGSLSAPDLHILDLSDPSHPVWKCIQTTGPSPGMRYGHLMAYSKPNLIIFGGNDGMKALNDVWTMNLESQPLRWEKVVFADGETQPTPRVYCSGDVIRDGGAAGMLVIHGGRTQDGVTRSDLWGLRQHRNKRWDWVPGPTSVKSGSLEELDTTLGLGRFQHTCIAIGTKLLVLGGRSSNPTNLPAVAYDTESCSWSNLNFSLDRYRHSACIFPTPVTYKVLIYGGFQQNSTHPTNQLQAIDPFAATSGGSITSDASPVTHSPLRGPRGPQLTTISGSVTAPMPSNDDPLISSDSSDDLGNQRRAGSFPTYPSPHADGVPESSATNTGQTVTLSTHVHTTVDVPFDGAGGTDSMLQRVALNRLGDESRRLRGYRVPPAAPSPDDSMKMIESIISRLLKPSMLPSKLERDFNPHLGFILTVEEINQLTKKVIAILRTEPMVLKLRAPIKIYGDIHGQHYDLMRMFKTYKAPVMEDCTLNNQDLDWDSRIEGDLDSTDYLFLGDYVDRGTNSLEVICLLFALKVRFPGRIHLLRGNHEDAVINSIYGFKDECRNRLQENVDHPESCWSKINRVFDYLPMGALIDKRILCIHGGIGGNVNTIAEIEELPRPLKVAQVPTTKMEQRVTDLLWSDPSENDSSLGVVPNDVRDPDGSGHIVKFGPDRVVQFLQDNNLELIIRAHECVMDGIERFAGGRLITLFSATDYCGTHKNAGALLFVRRDLTIVPKIIYPPGRENQYMNGGSTWILDPTRPPTPPRNLGSNHGDRNSKQNERNHNLPSGGSTGNTDNQTGDGHRGRHEVY